MQHSRRRRGVLLTPKGKQKLIEAITINELHENHSNRYTIEDLSERTGLDSGTVAKVLNAQSSVDRATIDRFFRSFCLEIQPEDYSHPNSTAIHNHVEVIFQGVAAWHDWIKINPQAKQKLKGVDLSETNLNGIDLSSATLDQAIFSRANLSRADLSEANLHEADLSQANLIGANLSHVSFVRSDLRSADLSGANLSGADLSGADLSQANLSGANLSEAKLNYADCSDANFSRVALSRASLVAVRALRTDFTAATFTGACIEDWNINGDTKLDGVICDYIYLKSNLEERCPSDPAKIFEVGDFAMLFQKAISTVDLIFRHVVNWEAFAYSWRKLQVKADTTDLTIQSIENKGDGSFVIRVSLPPNADKAEVEQSFEREYQTALRTVEEKYRYQLQAKDREIELYRQQSERIWEIAKLMASKTVDRGEMSSDAKSDVKDMMT